MTDGPYLGDIRLCNPERDKGKPLREVTDFEVWDGQRWVHANEDQFTLYDMSWKSSS